FDKAALQILGNPLGILSGRPMLRLVNDYSVQHTAAAFPKSYLRCILDLSYSGQRISTHPNRFLLIRSKTLVQRRTLASSRYLSRTAESDYGGSTPLSREWEKGEGHEPS